MATATRRQLIEDLRVQQEIERRLSLARCQVDPWYWLHGFTKTFDPHALHKGVETVKPFPDFDYFKATFAAFIVGMPALEKAQAVQDAGGMEPRELDRAAAEAAYAYAVEYLKDPSICKPDPVIAVPKSREMMLSWAVAGYITWDCQFHPHHEWVLQSKDEDTAIKLMRYCKFLYSSQPQWMKERFPLAGGKFDTESGRQSLKLQLWNHGGSIEGIPSGADKARAAHPTGFFFDEACYIAEFEAAYGSVNNVTPKIIAVSSAKPGNLFQIWCEG